MLSFCQDFTYKFGGPYNLFMIIDENDDHQLSYKEFADAIQELGFFEMEGCPQYLNTREKVMSRFFPVCDFDGAGAISILVSGVFVTQSYYGNLQ